jgi:hypothetical protein
MFFFHYRQTFTRSASDSSITSSRSAYLYVSRSPPRFSQVVQECDLPRMKLPQCRHGSISHFPAYSDVPPPLPTRRSISSTTTMDISKRSQNSIYRRPPTVTTRTSQDETENHYNIII